MEYMLLIYSSEGSEPQGDAMADVLRRYDEFTQDVRSNGKLVTAARLRPISEATTVRVKNDETLVTDGPFAETKEQLGGYYLLDCENLDEALEYAAKIPSAEHGSVEVRPVWA